MKTAILCPGPSLSQTFKTRDAYAAVAGVNRAVHRAPCDVWVSLDPSPIEAIPLQWFTTENTIHNLQASGRLFRGGKLSTVEATFEQIPSDMGGACWDSFSSTAALVSMFLRGAKSIDVYGYDGTNAPDFDGAALHSNQRGADRWANEAHVWEVVTKWLSDRGCEVRRITP